MSGGDGIIGGGSNKPSLKSAQLHAIHRLLSINDSSDPTSSSSTTTSNSTSQYLSAPAGTSHNQWKILIYDKPCRSIISPLLPVSQLRSRGVTLHLLISTEREAIPDVPAVYFVEPTRANLSIIAEDCAKRLYQKVHIHFVTKLDRALMEEFGRLIVQANCLDMIASLHDEYLDFISLENNLFALSNKQDSYAMIHGRGVTDKVMENYLNEIAYGLLSVVGCTGSVPVIRCPKGGAPEMVARKLNKLIAEHPSTNTNKAQHNRPLLVLLDRTMDLMTPLQHSSTYQALMDDLLNHKANRVEFIIASEGARPVPKKFDLDANDDPFYANYKFQPFPEAIEANGAELEDVTARENAIRSKTVTGDGSGNPDALGGGTIVHDADGSNAASELASAVDSLPQLLEQKKQLEMHTSILQAVMNEVAARDVPQFYELESALASGQYKSDPAKAKSEVLALVTDAAKGNVEDKIRLIIVFCLATTAPGADVTEVSNAMAQALESRGSTANNGGAGGSSASHGLLSKEDRIKLEKGLNAIEYLKNLRSLQMIPNISAEADDSTSGGGAGSGPDMLSTFMTRATNQATGLLAKATEKVSTMLGKISKHRATRVVENLCEMKPNSEDDEYLYLDPRVKGDVDVTMLKSRSMARTSHREVICFVIGGGCYAEYQNLQMIANERRSITYGSTELVSPCEFLAQLGKMS